MVRPEPVISAPPKSDLAGMIAAKDIPAKKAAASRRPTTGKGNISHFD